jgi:hypothetical protein
MPARSSTIWQRRIAEHDLFRKPVPTFRDHALADALLRDAARLACDVIAHERFGLSCMRAPIAGCPFERRLHGRINRLRSALPSFDRSPPITIRPRIHASPTAGWQSRSGICDLSSRGDGSQRNSAGDRSRAQGNPHPISRFTVLGFFGMGRERHAHRFRNCRGDRARADCGR